MNGSKRAIGITLYAVCKNMSPSTTNYATIPIDQVSGEARHEIPEAFLLGSYRRNGSQAYSLPRSSGIESARHILAQHITACERFDRNILCTRQIPVVRLEFRSIHGFTSLPCAFKPLYARTLCLHL